jgi:hypothetical protein
LVSYNWSCIHIAAAMPTKELLDPAMEHCLQSCAAVSLDKSRLRDLTSDLQIRALNHSGAPQYSVFLKIFVISNLREKQPNKPMFFWEKSAKTYPGARK